MQQFAFGPKNYRVMGVGLALLAAGFITMMFGDRANYGEDFVGITLGPILLIVGFVVEFYAILLRDPAAVVSGGAAAAPATAGTAPGAAPVVGSPLCGPATPPAPAPAAAPAYKRL